MTTHRHSSQEQDGHPADQLAAEIAGALQAQDTRKAPVPKAVTWTCVQLPERIRQAGAALASAAEPAHGQMPEPDHAPLADREAEP
jgi:hypothetical protein